MVILEYLHEIVNKFYKLKKKRDTHLGLLRSDGQKPASSEEDFNTSQNELQEKIFQNKKRNN